MNSLVKFKKYWGRQKNFGQIAKQEILEMIREEPSVFMTPLYAKRKWFNR